MSESIVLVLKTGTPSTLAQENGQRKVITWLEAKKIRFREIDGSDPEQKEVRDELFKVSNVRGNYPQVFITDQASETKFIGCYEKIEELVESDTMDEATLAQYPDLPTFSRVFAECKNA